MISLVFMVYLTCTAFYFSFSHPCNLYTESEFMANYYKDHRMLAASFVILYDAGLCESSCVHTNDKAFCIQYVQWIEYY